MTFSLVGKIIIVPSYLIWSFPARAISGKKAIKTKNEIIIIFFILLYLFTIISITPDI